MAGTEDRTDVSVLLTQMYILLFGFLRNTACAGKLLTYDKADS